MFRYRFFSVSVSCFIFSCGNNIPQKMKSLDKVEQNALKENKVEQNASKENKSQSWETIQSLVNLPDNLFKDVQKDKDSLRKMLPKTEAEFKSKNFARKRHGIYRKSLKLYQAVVKNLQEEVKDFDNKKNKMQRVFSDQKSEIERLKKELDAQKK